MFSYEEVAGSEKSAETNTPSHGKGRKATHRKVTAKGKGKSAPAVEAAAAAVSICDGKGALARETAGIALPASDEIDEFPRADIRS